MDANYASTVFPYDNRLRDAMTQTQTQTRPTICRISSSASYVTNFVSLSPSSAYGPQGFTASSFHHQDTHEVLWPDDVMPLHGWAQPSAMAVGPEVPSCPVAGDCLYLDNNMENGLPGLGDGSEQQMVPLQGGNGNMDFDAIQPSFDGIPDVSCAEFEHADAVQDIFQTWKQGLDSASFEPLQGEQPWEQQYATLDMEDLATWSHPNCAAVDSLHSFDSLPTDWPACPLGSHGRHYPDPGEDMALDGEPRPMAPDLCSNGTDSTESTEEIPADANEKEAALSQPVMVAHFEHPASHLDLYPHFPRDDGLPLQLQLEPGSEHVCNSAPSLMSPDIHAFTDIDMTGLGPMETEPVMSQEADMEPVAADPTETSPQTMAPGDALLCLSWAASACASDDQGRQHEVKHEDLEEDSSPRPFDYVASPETVTAGGPDGNGYLLQSVEDSEEAQATEVPGGPSSPALHATGRISASVEGGEDDLYSCTPEQHHVKTVEGVEVNDVVQVDQVDEVKVKIEEENVGL